MGRPPLYAPTPPGPATTRVCVAATNERQIYGILLGFL